MLRYFPGFLFILIVSFLLTRYLFWLDGTHNARFNIFTAGLDGRNHRLIWNGVGMVMSLAIDYTGAFPLLSYTE